MSNSVGDKAPPTICMRHLLQICTVRRRLTTAEKFTFIKRKYKKEKTKNKQVAVILSSTYAFAEGQLKMEVSNSLRRSPYCSAKYR